MFQNSAPSCFPPWGQFLEVAVGRQWRCGGGGHSLGGTAIAKLPVVQPPAMLGPVTNLAQPVPLLAWPFPE